LIPRALRFEVTERIEASGAVDVPFDVGEFQGLIAELREHEVESIAVCLLHAYVNPAHEREAAAVMRELCPEIPFSLSSDVLPEYREYERSSTTAINAFVAPGMSRYLAAMAERLRQRDARCAVRIMQSNGGLMSIERARRLPASTVLSGVAAGALGGARLAMKSGRKNVLTLDMGGTSCDLAVASDGEVLTNRTYEVGGLPIRLPALDVHTIGAGGGSIAYLDAGGGVHVGPRSAGADPGPACYGKGGVEPTVTDANLVLGRIPAALLGGEVPLDAERAAKAIEETVARSLGLTVPEAAAGIVQVINAAMAREMRVLTVQRGIDPREFALVAFGGGGPVHAVELARELEMAEVIIPPSPGVTSAVGLLLADTRYDRVRTVLIGLPAESSSSSRDEAMQILRRTFAELEQEIRAELTSDMDRASLRVVRELEMRYLRQGHELRVPVIDEACDANAIEQAFSRAHTDRFGYIAPEESMLIVNAILTLVVDRQTMLGTTTLENGAGPATHTRPVWFDGDWCDAQVLRREALGTDQALAGPAIVEQTDTTVVLPPGASLQVDDDGNLVIQAGRRPRSVD
jgi:N-methylhydantoinase A